MDWSCAVRKPPVRYGVRSTCRDTSPPPPRLSYRLLLSGIGLGPHQPHLAAATSNRWRAGIFFTVNTGIRHKALEISEISHWLLLQSRIQWNHNKQNIVEQVRHVFGMTRYVANGHPIFVTLLICPPCTKPVDHQRISCRYHGIG